MNSIAADRQLIVEAVYKYALGYDEADFVLLAEAFCQDAVSGGKITNSELHWGPMNGRDQIISGLKDMRMAPNQPRHCISNPLFISQSDRDASLRCYLTLMASENGAASVKSVGSLSIRVRKDEDHWRIYKLDVTLDAPF